MRPAIRVAFVALFIGGMTLGGARFAAAQNTDEAHELCAQGGGFGAPLSGAGEGSARSVGSDIARLPHFGAVSTSRAADDDGAGSSGSEGGGGGGGGGEGGGEGSFLSDFAHRAARSENEAGAGEAGVGKERANGGLGGSNLGGGAGGCDAPPRKLPATGSSAAQVAYMGAAFVGVGLLLIAGKRRWTRFGGTPQEFDWDSFGPRSV